MLEPMEFHADTTQLVQMLKKGHHNVQLDAEAWDRLIAWIDLNCPFHGTWGEEIAVPEWKGVNEVGLVRAANGHIVAYCRTDLSAWFRDPAHRKPEGMDPPDLYSGFGISISRDDGKRWSPVNRLFDHGRHFVSFVLLPNRDLVMTYMVRIGYPHNVDGFPTYGIEALVSRDHGVSWDMEHRIILDEWTGNMRGHPGAWWASPQSTSSVLLPAGLILTAYGRAYRCLPTVDGQIGPPRDIGLVRWFCGREHSSEDAG